MVVWIGMFKVLVSVLHRNEQCRDAQPFEDDLGSSGRGNAHSCQSMSGNAVKASGSGV